MRKKKLALTPLEIDDLLLPGNLFANESCPPSFMPGEVRIINSVMGSIPMEDWYLDKASYKEWKNRRNFNLLAIAFAITMPKELS